MDGNSSGGLMLLSLMIFLFAGFLNPIQSNDDEVQESHKTNEAPRLHPTAYTLQEKMFICAKLESLGQPRHQSTWEKIERAMKIEYDAGTLGFKRARKAKAIRRQFFTFMMKNDNDIIPDTLKAMVEEPPEEYSQQEDDLIIKLLMSHCGTQLHNKNLWQVIKTEHDLNVDSNSPGFGSRKSEDALRLHYYQRMEPLGRVPQDVLQKFGRVPTTQPGRSGGFVHRTKRKHTSLSSEEALQEVDIEFIDFFAKERQNASDNGDDEEDENVLTELKLWDNGDDDENELPKLKLCNNGDGDEDDEKELPNLRLCNNGDDDEDDNELTKLKL